jgi:hypothetical protein
MWLKLYDILLHGQRLAGLIIRWSPLGSETASLIKHLGLSLK